MKFFRLKHKQTGLYYCPKREIKVSGRYVKSNLSKKGKIYQRNPSKHIITYYDHTRLEQIRHYPFLRSTVLLFEPEDFEVEPL